jgi:hypothetical protein
MTRIQNALLFWLPRVDESMSKIANPTIPSGGEVLRRWITVAESGVTATVSGRFSTGVGHNYRVVLIRFDDLGKVMAFSLDTAVELVASPPITARSA